MSMDLIVVNYRTPQDLDGFLMAYTRVAGEVDARLHVVNVDPTVADEETLDAWTQDTRIVACASSYRDNVGYATACNNAATLGLGDIIGFFNADTRLHSDALQKITAAFAEHPDVAIVGPKQINEHNQITHAGIFGSNAKPQLRGWKISDRGQFDDDRTDAVSVSGSAYFIRRDVWEQLTDCEQYQAAAPDAAGAFLPTQFYFEETWCSYHARAHDWKVMYLGTATMTHFWHRAVIDHRMETEAGVWYKDSKRLFRRACDLHDLSHD